MKIQVKVVKKKVVKPCTPTPQNLKNYKLSLMDELLPPNKFRVLLFYAGSSQQQQQQRSIIVNSLEESLAKVLVPFYPLAGRLRLKDGYVDCSDQGAEFVEAEAPHAEVAALLLERNLHNLDGASTFLPLLIQITRLHCGGLVIGVAVSYKIFDAASLVTFIAAWSNATTANINHVNIPVLDSAKLFPAKISYRGTETVRKIVRPPARATVAKRFVFDEEAIARLRSKLRPKSYSRVRVVCPFIAKCLIGVGRAKHDGTTSRRPCYMVQGITLERERSHLCQSMHAETS